MTISPCIRRTGGALLVAAGLLSAHAPPAGAQRSRSVAEWTSAGRTVRLEATGTVGFTDDDRAVARVSPGGRLLVEERRRGGPTSRAVLTGSAGGVERAFSGDADEAWLRGILPEVIRESGIGAEARVARLVARGGVDAALREIDAIRSDGVRRLNFSHLLRHPAVDAAASVRVLESVDRRRGSDGDRADLLRGAAASLQLEDSRVRAAYFRAVRGIGSDGDRAATLRALPTRGRSDATWTAWLQTARTLGSDGDKAAVLAGFARAVPLRDAAVRGAFLDAATTIHSDGDLHHVLRTALTLPGTDAAFGAEIVRAAQEIGSDGDRAALLLAVEPRLLAAPEVREAYRSAAGSIRSDGDREAALAHLARGTPDGEARRVRR